MQLPGHTRPSLSVPHPRTLCQGPFSLPCTFKQMLRPSAGDLRMHRLHSLALLRPHPGPGTPLSLFLDNSSSFRSHLLQEAFFDFLAGSGVLLALPVPGLPWPGLCSPCVVFSLQLVCSSSCRQSQGSSHLLGAECRACHTVGIQQIMLKGGMSYLV